MWYCCGRWIILFTEYNKRDFIKNHLLFVLFNGFSCCGWLFSYHCIHRGRFFLFFYSFSSKWWLQNWFNRILIIFFFLYFLENLYPTEYMLIIIIIRCYKLLNRSMTWWYIKVSKRDGEKMKTKQREKKTANEMNIVSIQTFLIHIRKNSLQNTFFLFYPHFYCSLIEKMRRIVL